MRPVFMGRMGGWRWFDVARALVNGAADFYASDIASLKEEGAKSLAAFLDVCEESSIEPYRRSKALTISSVERTAA